MVKFLPSYVGSKASWVERLEFIRGRSIVEPFAGSAVISANLAGKTHLNDLDPYIYLILSRFDEQVVPHRFTKQDYMIVRSREDWWRWAYCLQKMSFSGVFRWSRNGYNVPPKPDLEVRVRNEYLAALDRWRSLRPHVTNVDFTEVNLLAEEFLVLDPPYEGSNAAYNTAFDTSRYWRWVEGLSNDMIIFDRVENLETKGLPVTATRTMTVNGRYASDVEAIALRLDGAWQTSLNELTLF